MAQEAMKIDLNEKQVDERVGANVRSIRMLRGLSQEKLGEAVGITFQQIQKYEKGSNRISASRLVQFSKVLSCRLDDLFEGTTDDEGDQAGPVKVMSKEATTVAARFEKITDPGVRKKITGLISALANSEDDAE